MKCFSFFAYVSPVHRVGPYQPAVVLVSVQPGARCAELGERVLARDLPQQGELVLGALDRDAVVLLQLNEGAVAKVWGGLALLKY